jgi:hypothetical protein
MSVCCICLEKCSTRLQCGTCTSYIHPKCFGKYVTHSTDNELHVIGDRVVMSLPLYVECPMCRGPIYNLKPVTRSDTKSARTMCLLIAFYDSVQLSFEIVDRDAWRSVIDVILYMIKSNISLIQDDHQFRDVVLDYLVYLRDVECMSSVTQYIELFHSN